MHFCPPVFHCDIRIFQAGLIIGTNNVPHTGNPRESLGITLSFCPTNFRSVKVKTCVKHYNSYVTGISVIFSNLVTVLLKGEYT